MPDYGAANKFDFDNRQKWHTVASVPLLDEHELTNDAGRPIATVDRAALEEIARNNNRKVYETGDPATLILGHTSDDPRAPEKPAKGFVVNYSVKPFKRDESGRVVYAIHGDYKLRPQNAHLVEEYPRRSVELWWHKKDIDPIAMLGGSSPERDLGAVIRNGRLNHVALGSSKSSLKNGRPKSEVGEVVRFHRRGPWAIENYPIEEPPPKYRYSCAGKVEKVRYAEDESGDTDDEQYSPEDRERMDKPRAARDRDVSRRREEAEGDRSSLEARRDRRKLPPGSGGSGMGGTGPKGRYGQEEMPLDTHDPGDGGVDAEPGADDWHGTEGDDTDPGGDDGGSGPTSPAVEELLQSKQFRDLQSKLDMLFDAIMGGPGGAGASGAGGGGRMGGGDDGIGEMPAPGAGAPPPAAPPGGPGAPPMGGGGGGPPPEEEDSRRGMGQKPVQMSATDFPNSTGFPGAQSTNIPDTGSRRSRMSRGTPKGVPMTATERQLQDKVARLERRDRENRLRYAATEAARRVEALVNEGFLFGQTPAEHDEGVEEYKRLFAGMLAQAGSEREAVADIEAEERMIRRAYSKRRTDPARTQVGLSRYARDPNHEQAPGGRPKGEAFEPQSDEEVCEYADLVGVKKLSREEADKTMLRRRLSRR